VTYHDEHDPDLHPEEIPPGAMRYMAVWITLAIVLLPLVVWAALA
jgi:hypothetical protein